MDTADREHPADLAAAWRDLAGPGAAARAVGEELLRRWAEPHRRYHTLDHLRAVLDAVAGLAGAARDPAAVRYAAWFHDAVYDGVPGEDEERSARLAEELLPRCGVPDRRVREAARLVRRTADHSPGPDDADGAVLCDADLAVLGGDPAAYTAYAAAVRQEYRHVADEDFRAGRIRVLRALLERPALYRTGIGRARWEERARANLAAELADLGGGGEAAFAPPQP